MKREQVTAVIRDLWAQALDSDELPGDLDFYAAGGSSLLSLILLTELNEAFATEFEIAELVDRRTIDRQAEAVWNRMTAGAAARDEQTPLVPLARAREGSGEQDATLVAVHDVSGDIYGYASLAGELSGRVDLYGIKLASERFDAPRALSIPDLASEYVAELESAFGDSRRLVILGWSLGGMVGFEMAKLLDRRHRSVARLVLIDSPYELGLPGPDDVPLMARVIPHLSSLNARELVRYVNRFRSVLLAGRSYRPTGATAAPIEFLTASRSQSFDPRWSTHTLASFRRRSLDGDHFSILDRASIRATAQAIIPSDAQ